MTLWSDGSPELGTYKASYRYILDQNGIIHYITDNNILNSTLPVDYLIKYGPSILALKNNRLYGFSRNPRRIVDQTTVYNVQVRTAIKGENIGHPIVLGYDGNVYNASDYYGTITIKDEKFWSNNNARAMQKLSQDIYGLYVENDFYLACGNTDRYTYKKLTSDVTYASGSEIHGMFIYKRTNVYMLPCNRDVSFNDAILMNGKKGLPSSILKIAVFDNNNTREQMFVLGGDNKLYYSWYNRRTNITVTKNNTAFNELSFSLYTPAKDMTFYYMSDAIDDECCIVLVRSDRTVWVVDYTGSEGSNDYNTYSKFRQLTDFGFIENKGFIYRPDPNSETFISKSESNDRTFYLKTTSSISSSQGNVVNYVTEVKF